MSGWSEGVSRLRRDDACLQDRESFRLGPKYRATCVDLSGYPMSSAEGRAASEQPRPVRDPWSSQRRVIAFQPQALLSLRYAAKREGPGRTRSQALPATGVRAPPSRQLKVRGWPE